MPDKMLVGLIGGPMNGQCVEMSLDAGPKYYTEFDGGYYQRPAALNPTIWEWVSTVHEGDRYSGR